MQGEWLHVGLGLSCQSGADVSLGWGSNAVTVVERKEKINFISFGLGPCPDYCGLEPPEGKLVWGACGCGAPAQCR